LFFYCLINMSQSLIIGITGGSGSGKTSFIRALADRFSEKELCIISQDDYYRPIEEQYIDSNGIVNYDLPSSIDLRAFAEDIKKLNNGEIVERMEYTFNNILAESQKIVFKPAPIILVEGLFVFYMEELKDILQFKVFVHAEENTKLIRRIKRDQMERNYPLDDVLYRYEYHVNPSFRQFIQPYIEDADIIINNSNDYKKGLRIIEGFFQDHLTRG